MPNDKVREYNEHLVSIAKELDISPSDYQKATERYQAVAKYLNEIEYEGALNGVLIYAQGSFELGTVTRPIKDSKEAGYDIDLVCEMSIPKTSTSPDYIKHAIGNRLKENQRYSRILGEEGKRCWKLEYAEDNGVDFHMDVLPSIRESEERIDRLRVSTDYGDLVDTAIAITNKKESGSYAWLTSNPRGYSDWFGIMNNNSYLAIETSAKKELFESNKEIFASVNDVPGQLIRTPLQRAIQILKRHRDFRFSGHTNEEFKPISMIITTLATHFYNNEDNVYIALKNIIAQFLGHLPLIEGADFKGLRQYIIRKPDGAWKIENPVDSEENFADRWHEEGDIRARSFFEWVEWVKKDIEDNRMFDIGSKKEDDFSKLGAPTVITERSKPHIEIKGTKPWGNLY